MISLQNYSFAQLHAETIKSSDIQMSFSVGEVYANRWVEFIQSFDLRKYDLSNNGIVRTLTMVMHDSTIIIVEISTDFLSDCKKLSISINNKSFETSYRNYNEFNKALFELSKYYEQNYNSIQGFNPE